jgi:hypothetical protein
MLKTETHFWQFKARFRRHSFGWRSPPAIVRIREAVSEIKKVARRDRQLGGDGAVLFLERLSPALEQIDSTLEQIDSSSGAIGTACASRRRRLASCPGEAPEVCGVRRHSGGRWSWNGLER